jgi:hypothetical protein
VIVVLVALLAPSSLPAQVRVAVSGFGGIYLSTADLFDGVLPTELGSAALKFNQKTGFTVGGRLAVWPTSRIGIEAEGAYVGSDVEGNFLVSVGGNLVPRSGTEDANLFLGSINVIYAVIQPPLEPLSIYVSGGVGLVSRGGDGFRVFDDTSDIAGVAGLGLKYGVAAGTWIRIDLKDYISSFNEKKFSDIAVDGGGAELQNDLLITVSFEFSFTPGG